MFTGSTADLQKKFFGGVVSKGFEQITGLSTAKELNVPAGAEAALIQATTQAIRYRDDGTNPSATVGMLLASGDSIYYTGVLQSLKFIEVSPSAVINVCYYG